MSIPTEHPVFAVVIVVVVVVVIVDVDCRNLPLKLLLLLLRLLMLIPENYLADIEFVWVGGAQSHFHVN